MDLSKEDILNAISEMSVMEVVELISDMEEKFGVSAAAAVAVAPAAAGGDAGDAGGAAEQTEFDVVLSSAGDKKSERDQSSPCDHWTWSERSQSFSRRRAFPSKGSCIQRRSRGCAEAA